MIDFRPLDPAQKDEFDGYLMCSNQRGCEYSFANLFLWGRQRAAIRDGALLLFAQFNRRSVYPFPAGCGDVEPALRAVIRDAQSRGIPCRITAMSAADCETLEQTFPGRFHYHHDRDAYDYVYDINDLADLKGRKLQRKRNHLNRFRQEHPDCHAVEIDGENRLAVGKMLAAWYTQRLRTEPYGDYLMEQTALRKAMHNRAALGLEGLALMEHGQVLAMTLGSRLTPDTFDIHFEKALPQYDGAYAAINQAFAQYLREKHPELRYLNREDDLGREGLRKAKLSYCPHHLVEKQWACLLEDGCEY